MRETVLTVLAALAIWLASAAAVAAHEIALDTKAAHAVLDALVDPTLDEARAREIARLPGDQALMRKMLTYSADAGEARFVVELLASAHGQVAAGKAWYGFDEVKRNRAAVERTLAKLEADPKAVTGWINGRIEPVSPPGPPQRLKGFLIAGGRATGFSLGGPTFYLNISRFRDEPEAAKYILAHELYHAVQSVALEARHGGAEHEFNAKALAAMKTKAARDRYVVRALFANLMDEGVADYVSDPSLIPDEGPYSHDDRASHLAQLNRPERLTALLDMSLIALTAPRPIDFEDTVAVEFHADQPLYTLGYAMTKAVVEAKGPRRIGELITGSGCGLVREYLALARSDPKLIQLGEATKRLAAADCR